MQSPEPFGTEKSRREFIRDLTAAGVGVTLTGFASRAGLFAAEPPTAALPASARKSTILSGFWRFQKEEAEPPAGTPRAQPKFDDHTWELVGVPHSFNDTDTFQNAQHSESFQGNVWYRRPFKLAPEDKGKKVFLEFEGVNIGTAVYVNGKFMPGNTAVPQPAEVTHVGNFLPFLLDITKEIDPAGENVIAVRVSNISANTGYGGFGGEGPTKGNVVGKAFYSDPKFANYLGFGMGCGGIVGRVILHVTNPVHVPFDSYSPLKKWGTYVAPTEVTDESAKIRIQTNVENESAEPKEVTLATKILDAANKTVLVVPEVVQSIAPGATALFDQTATVDHPQLWYPNNSPHGKPAMYRVVSEVKLAGTTVDQVESPLGIRAITWDDNYCYVNGKKHLLNGFGQRNIYPTLGSALPAEIQWNDVRLIAECGGNTLRVGHVPAMVETIKACDAYGVLILDGSGDNEWALAGEPAMTYKREYDRDMIIRFRNHPSIAVWESNNGVAKMANPHYSPKETITLVDQWDSLQPRIVGSRDDSDYFPTDRKLMIGYTNQFRKIPGSPSMDWEVYGGRWGPGERSVAMARFDYEHEKEFADYYVKSYFSDLSQNACGWIAWMLAEGQGEGFLKYLNGMTKQKSLGSCAMDGNRFPKISYRIFKNALWVPFSIKPGVTLQSHWNLSGEQEVDAWSNCPAVELVLNNISLGVRKPDANLRCTWSKVMWKPGTLQAFGLDESGKRVCADVRQTAGAPARVILTAEPRLTRPSGEKFKVIANGTDVAILTACVVDARGIWCPLADQKLRFKVRGAGIYRGSYNFYVTPGQPIGYHSPGDAELQAEGGLMRIAVRSTFQAGRVDVTVEAPGLAGSAAAFVTEPMAANHEG